MSFKKVRKNFTLVELLTVVAIIGVLIGIVMGLMSLASGKMAEARTRGVMSQISVALENYKAKYGYFIQQASAYTFYLDVVDSTSATPSDDQKITNNFCQFIDYQALLNKDTQRGSGAVSSTNRAWVVDGYGNPLIYRCPGYFNRNGFDLGSLGADGKFGLLSSGGVSYNLNGTSGQETVSNGYQAKFGQGDDIANFTR